MLKTPAVKVSGELLLKLRMLWLPDERLMANPPPTQTSSFTPGKTLVFQLAAFCQRLLPPAPVHRIVQLGRIVTDAVAESPGTAKLAALIATTTGAIALCDDGGAVYKPSWVMVPTVAFPPTISSTLQVTRVSFGPVIVAVNCWLVPRTSVACAGETFIVAKSTVKSCGDVAEPKGVLTVIRPVVAPIGTCVVRLVGVAAKTGAETPLKATALSFATALNPLPMIST